MGCEALEAHWSGALRRASAGTAPAVPILASDTARDERARVRQPLLFKALAARALPGQLAWALVFQARRGNHPTSGDLDSVPYLVTSWATAAAPSATPVEPRPRVFASKATVGRRTVPRMVT